MEETRTRHVRQASAWIKGSSRYPQLNGSVEFFQMKNGVAVAAEFTGLPTPLSQENRGEKNESQIFAFHIHEGESCTGNETDPFADAKGHYNPGNQPHPLHAGDMPPIFGNGGQAQLLFVTDRFTVDDVIGRTVIVHGNPDDFTTQPSGNAGEKIGCGIIAAAYGERAL
ncbi:MAG: superoxide dismutase family protein [Firmicutes bacterium]|nr:superoxide dismutase family protein [Bacillota bacterium]MDD7601797.1 superoxide dismutase family protein [Bacillota bacterium]MDY5855810.1 superoxide dismutase family protein [Anaerovoracaceae bacterium]